MEIKGQTVYVLIIEGQYPGNNSLPEVFADKKRATERKDELEAVRTYHPGRQQYWCEVEEMEIQ